MKNYVKVALIQEGNVIYKSLDFKSTLASKRVKSVDRKSDLDREINRSTQGSKKYLRSAYIECIIPVGKSIFQYCHRSFRTYTKVISSKALPTKVIGAIALQSPRSAV